MDCLVFNSYKRFYCDNCDKEMLIIFYFSKPSCPYCSGSIISDFKTEYIPSGARNILGDSRYDTENRKANI